MTPEEMNRTIEFIVQSHARLAAAQEQDREDRIQFERESKARDRRLAKLIEIQTHLLERQTARLDGESERIDRYEQENRALQRRHEEFRQEFLELMGDIRATLNRIVDKLSDRLN